MWRTAGKLPEMVELVENIAKKARRLNGGVLT
jgi:hypothetical protein